MDWLRSRLAAVPPSFDGAGSAPNLRAQDAKLELYPDLSNGDITSPTSSSIFDHGPPRPIFVESTLTPSAATTDGISNPSTIIGTDRASSAQPFVTDIAILFRRYDPTSSARIPPFVPLAWRSNKLSLRPLDDDSEEGLVRLGQDVDVAVKDMLDAGTTSDVSFPRAVFTLADSVLYTYQISTLSDLALFSLLGLSTVTIGYKGCRALARNQFGLFRTSRRTHSSGSLARGALGSERREEVMTLHRKQSGEWERGMKKMQELMEEQKVGLDSVRKRLGAGLPLSDEVGSGIVEEQTPSIRQASLVAFPISKSAEDTSLVTTSILDARLAALETRLRNQTSRIVSQTVWGFMDNDEMCDEEYPVRGILDRLGSMEGNLAMMTSQLAGKPLLGTLSAVAATKTDDFWRGDNATSRDVIEAIQTGTLEARLSSLMPQIYDTRNFSEDLKAFDHPFRTDLRQVIRGYQGSIKLVEECDRVGGAGPLARTGNLTVLSEKVETSREAVARSIGKEEGGSNSLAVVESAARTDVSSSAGEISPSTEPKPIKRLVGRPRKHPLPMTTPAGQVTLASSVPAAFPPALSQDDLDELVTKDDLSTALDKLSNSFEEDLHRVAYDAANDALEAQSTDIGQTVDKQLLELRTQLSGLRRQIGAAKPLGDEVMELANRMDERWSLAQTAKHGPKLSRWDWSDEGQHDRAQALSRLLSDELTTGVREVLDLAEDYITDIKPSLTDEKSVAERRKASMAINETYETLRSIDALVDLFRSKEMTSEVQKDGVAPVVAPANQKCTTHTITPGQITMTAGNGSSPSTEQHPAKSIGGELKDLAARLDESWRYWNPGPRSPWMSEYVNGPTGMRDRAGALARLTKPDYTPGIRENLDIVDDALLHFEARGETLDVRMQYRSAQIAIGKTRVELDVVDAIVALLQAKEMTETRSGRGAQHELRKDESNVSVSVEPLGTPGKDSDEAIPVQEVNPPAAMVKGMEDELERDLRWKQTDFDAFLDNDKDNDLRASFPAVCLEEDESSSSVSARGISNNSEAPVEQSKKAKAKAKRERAANLASSQLCSTNGVYEGEDDLAHLSESAKVDLEGILDAE